MASCGRSDATVVPWKWVNSQLRQGYILIKDIFKGSKIKQFISKKKAQKAAGSTINFPFTSWASKSLLAEKHVHNSFVLDGENLNAPINLRMVYLTKSRTSCSLVYSTRLTTDCGLYSDDLKTYFSGTRRLNQIIQIQKIPLASEAPSQGIHKHKERGFYSAQTAAN